MKAYLRIIVIVVAAAFCATYVFMTIQAQGRRIPFSHNTKAHKTGKFGECSSCHVLPEANWKLPRRDNQEPFPDVTNFPYKRHATCNNCHIREVFSDGGVFCGACHTTASMKASGGRGVRPFPNRAHPTQFKTIFPHDVHQDIIAAVPKKTEYAVAHFISATYIRDDPPKAKPVFYNCAVCHKTIEPKPLPGFEARKPFMLEAVAPLVADTFIDPTNDKEKPITGDFFMTSPQGHESCFTCHYQFQNLPKGEQSCRGCHELTNPFKPYFDKNIINRYSLKFNHSTKGHIKECTSCHVQITASNSLRRKDEDGKLIVEDVPVVTCKSCHDGGSSKFERIISTELKKRKDNAAFQCIYCHTSAVGRFDVPASHKKP